MDRVEGDEVRPVVTVIVAPDMADPPGLDAIAVEADVRVVRSAHELADTAAAARVLAVYDFRTTLVPDFVRRAPRLEWVHAASAGVDVAMTPEVIERGLMVTNSRGVFDEPIAEYVLGAMLIFAKDVLRTLQLQRERRWLHRETERLAGRRLLVVGAGSIGHAVGRLALAVGVEVRGIAQTERRGDPVFGSVHPASQLLDHVGWADYIALTVPLTDATRGMFGRREIAACRPGARLINVARGSVVDQDALLEGLREGRLAGAVLDVFAEEPLPRDHPFWTMEQVVVTPHMAGDAEGWLPDLGALFVENFRRWRRGEQPRNVIRGSRGDRERTDAGE